MTFSGAGRAATSAFEDHGGACTSVTGIRVPGRRQTGAPPPAAGRPLPARSHTEPKKRLREYLDWRRRYDDWLAVTANSLLGLQRFDEAITAHRDAAAIYRKTGDRPGEANALSLDPPRR